MNKFPKKTHAQVFLQKNCVQRVKKSNFRHAVRLLRRCLNFFFFRESLNSTVPVSPFAPKNSPPDCFLNAAHPLRVRIPPPNSKKNIPAAAEMLFLARSEGFEPPIFRIGICCVIRLRHERIYTKPPNAMSSAPLFSL